jgi:hypothetical protein
MAVLRQVVDRPRAASPRAASRASLLSQIGWAPESDLDLPQWQAVGRSLGRLGRYSQWWIGDWLLYASGKWGEMYTEAAKITGYDYGSLRNMAYVAHRFELSRRRDKLSWTHHADVASLEPAEQDYWLDRAVEQRLNMQDLRTELRAAERLGAARSSSATPAPKDDSTPIVVCPKCGDAIQISVDVTEAIRSSKAYGRLADE